MIGAQEAVDVALCTIFAGAGWYCAHRCFGSRRRHIGGIDRINYGAHLLMNLSMLAMVWTVPRLVAWQMPLFAIICGWFAMQATGVPLTAAAWSVQPHAAGMHVRPSGRYDWTDRLRYIHHAAGMAAMVWMLDRMTDMSTTMPGMVTARRDSTALIAAGAGAYCLVAVVLLAAVAARGRPRPTGGHGSLADDVCHALMTIGTAVMILMVA